MPDFATETAEERVARLSAELAEEKKPNPFSYMVETSYRVNLDDDHDPFEHREPPVVRFALVSMPPFDKGSFTWTAFSSLQGGQAVPAGVNPKFCLRQLAASNPDKSVQMLQAFREALEAAIEKFQPHIVCFNELGLPSDNLAPMAEAKDLAWNASQAHGILVIAGSVHDSATLYNTAYYFRPKGPREGESFHKNISAFKAEELISTPALRVIKAVKFAGLRIAMMICLDVVVYDSVASVVKVADGLDVVLVPCHTKKFDDMASIARVASKAMPGVVAMVNADSPDWPARRCQVARFGEDKGPLPAAIEHLPSGAVISLVEIDRAEFEAKRTEWKKPLRVDQQEFAENDPTAQAKLKALLARIAERQDLEYLFGRRDMPTVRHL